MYELFLILIGFLWILIASIEDLKKREIANWLSFSLIVFGIGFRFFYSLFNENFGFFYQGLIWLGIFTLLGNLFYYSKVFAGGDAKLLISLGVILPFYDSFMKNFNEIILFFIIFFICGSLYGLFWSFFLAFKKFKGFKLEFKFQLRKNKILIRVLIIIGILFIILGIINIIFLIIGLMIFVFPYLFIFAKSIEESNMIKKIPVKELREGDWLYKDVKIGKKVINANWDGLNKEDIELISKKYKQIEIKEGIPFIPVFLITFVIWIFLRNSSWQPYIFGFFR